MKLQSVNPHDHSIVGEVNIATPQEVLSTVSAAKAAFPDWKATPIEKRAEFIKKYRELVSTHKDEIAKLISQEMGKPLNQSLDEVTGELDFLDYYATEGVKALADVTVQKTDSEHFYYRFEPYGVCAVITPWNFPLGMFNSGVIPTLIAGNTVVLKPTESSTLSQKLMMDLLQETGIPEGVANILLGAKDTGRQLIDAPIDLVWFTGSTVAGLDIYKKCGEKFIKCICELGGSSPAIVFPDAPLESTLENLYWARFLNTGQVCSAVKRLFVHKSIFDQVVSSLVKKVQTVKIGNPLEGPDLGPLVNVIQLEKLEAQVADAVSKGAKVEVGGARSTDLALQSGNYYQPTILTNVTEDMRLMTEEVFGPVLPIIPFETDEEVIRLANQTEYGLSAEIYTKDLAKAEKLTHLLDAGTVAINTDNYYKPMCPIGGYKKSGLGREYGHAGMQELAQIKLIVVKNP